MRRLAIGSLVAVLAIACSGKGKDKGTTPGSGSGSDGPAVYAKKIAVSWGFQPVGELADVFLVTTDETGKQVSHPVGRYKGTCATKEPAKEMNAINGAACTTAGGGGTELHAVARPDEIIVLQMGITPGATPDPMAREEIVHVKVPLGISIEAGK
jgi:hypothetical protein